MTEKALSEGPERSPFKITPMFEQFFTFKKENPGSILFFRMGDFYEMFFEDAELAARELQITLTSRNSNAENPIPMCGVPHHAAEGYIRQLNKKGYTVAICEQMEDPRAAKGLVRRSVIELRTPGTTVDEEALSAKEHNYLGSMYWDATRGKGAFAWLDYSTGSWSGLEGKKETDLWQWVRKMGPRELLVPDLPYDSWIMPSRAEIEDITLVRLPERGYFDLQIAAERICKAQEIRELGAVDLDNKPELTRACGALVGYLIQTQKKDEIRLEPFTPLNLNKHLILDEITERNLEIFRRLDGRKGQGTLWDILDETITPMGGRLLEERLRHPWRDLQTISAHADAVAFFHDNPTFHRSLREALKPVYDIERLTTRILLKKATPRDYISLRQSLSSLPTLAQTLRDADPSGSGTVPAAPFPHKLANLLEYWDPLTDICDLLERALVDTPPLTMTEGGLFRSGYNDELDNLIELSEHGQGKLDDLLKREQENNGLARLRLGYNRVFGYYFELAKSQADSVPGHFVRRQTVSNAERFITPELKDLEEKILAAKEERSKLEYQLFQDLSGCVAQARQRILYMAHIIGALDYWQSLAETARKRRWSRPTLNDGDGLDIVEGRHPVVEALAGPAGFIPNDLHMDRKRRLIIITGPNMAGKSTILRQVAIITILAQMGGFVPATEARLGVADRIFSRVGASDNLAQGHSTFMVEMMETARILRQATRRSLIILDELGRGTSTFDGLAIAWAVVEDLARRAEGSVRTLFATHYHELTALEGRIPGVHNMNIYVTDSRGEILFTRKLVPGPTDKSYGIEVARLAGVPKPVVQRAKIILEHLSKSQKSLAKTPQSEALQQLLPGVPLEASSQVPTSLLPPREFEVEHPLFVSLRDVDADNLTPMQALALITQWKQLWGEQHP